MHPLPQPKAKRMRGDAERLQKVLAQSGLGSRRALDARIQQGEVRVNGQAAVAGQQVTADDIVELDRHRYRVVANKTNAHRVLIYNKPAGQVCTRSDPDGRPTVFAQLPRLRGGRWISVGRLDISTTGLLLLTTDGALANAMMHPSSGVDREYVCRVRGQPSQDALKRLTDGVVLDDGPAHFSDLSIAGGSGENHWYHVVLMEGRNREVRRLWAAVGVEVSRLKRVRYGAVFLPARLKRGQYEEMKPNDVLTLREDSGLPRKSPQNLSLRTLKNSRRESRSGKGRKP